MYFSRTIELVAITSKHACILALKKLADKLKRAPRRNEFEHQFVGGHYALRKYYQDNFSKLLKDCGLTSYNDERVLNKLSPEDQSLKDTRIKLAEAKQDVHILRKQIAELANDAISSKKLREMIGILKERDFDQKKNWMTVNRPSKSKGTPLLMLSDIHFDEVVLANQIQGLNSYNREIAIKRIQHTVNTAIMLLTKEIKDAQYDGFVLCLGGDMVSGNIHEELAETNEAAILQTCMKLIEVLIDSILRLKATFKRVYVPCVVGNHGRLHRKPRMKNRVFDNYEWLIYSFVKRHFANDPDVTVDVPDGSDIQFRVYNKSILLTHGDQFSGGSGISGIFTPLMLGMSRKQKRNASVKNPFDLMICGHFHQLIMTQSLIVNGSVKGYDEYAFQFNFPFEPPQQALIVIHPIYGVTHQMPILCSGYSRPDKIKEQISIFK